MGSRTPNQSPNIYLIGVPNPGVPGPGPINSGGRAQLHLRLSCKEKKRETRSAEVGGNPWLGPELFYLMKKQRDGGWRQNTRTRKTHKHNRFRFMPGNMYLVSYVTYDVTKKMRYHGRE